MQKLQSGATNTTEREVMAQSNSTIDLEGGLKAYLDRRQDLNNGMGYDQLLAFVKDGISARKIAKIFGKHHHTIESWIKKLKESGII